MPEAPPGMARLPVMGAGDEPPGRTRAGD